MTLKLHSSNIFENNPVWGGISKDSINPYLLSFHSNRLSIFHRGEYLFIPFNTIVYIKASSNYTDIFTYDGKKYCISKTLKWVQNKLAHPLFIRCHNSYIVSTYYIKTFNPLTNQLMLESKECIPVSRSKKKNILQNFLFKSVPQG